MLRWEESKYCLGYQHHVILTLFVFLNTFSFSNAKATVVFSIRVYPEESTQIDPELQSIVRAVDSGFDDLRLSLGIEDPVKADVVITRELAEAVKAHAHLVVGGEVLSDFSSERLSGRVAAKTLPIDHDEHYSIVILDSTFTQMSSPIGLAPTILMVAHEFAHAFINQVRSSFGSTLESRRAPELYAQSCAFNAIEEYLVDHAADLIAGPLATVRVNGGQDLPLSRRVIHPSGDISLDAAANGLETIAMTIQMRRLGEVSIIEMWEEVWSLTSQLMIILAHVQFEQDSGTSDDESSVVTDERRFGPLNYCWSQLHALMRSALPIRLEYFAKSEAKSIECGSASIIEFWNALGLSFTPMGEGFHIAIGSADSVWAGPS